MIVDPDPTALPEVSFTLDVDGNALVRVRISGKLEGWPKDWADAKLREITVIHGEGGITWYLDAPDALEPYSVSRWIPKQGV